MTRITTVISGTGKYEICRNSQGYWAIEHRYIGSDGRLSAPINGIQGLLSDTKEEAITKAIKAGKAKEYKEKYNPTDEQMLSFIITLYQQ